MEMRINILLFLIFGMSVLACAQDLYFPPVSGSSWDTTEPESLGWCEEGMEDLFNFLDEENTKAFLVLKDGKIVIERYFDNFTVDSVWYWASAGKTLTAFTTGIAQREGFLDIEDSTTDYLGAGWTNCSALEEEKIKIIDQLRMTTGMNDEPDPFCTDPECLECIAEPGTRWSYHNAPYTLLDNVISEATGRNLNVYVNQKINQPTGMQGLFVKLGFNNVFLSTARSMARFGLLILNRGVWDDVDVLGDDDFYEEMVNTSQEINPSYGYLWWLNGKDKYMLPSTQFVFDGPAFPNAPSDMFAALGANGQVINVVPSENLVIIRMGNSPDPSLIANLFVDKMWEFLNVVICEPNSVREEEQKIAFKVFPNPGNGELSINTTLDSYTLILRNISGLELGRWENLSLDSQLDPGYLPKGVYFLEVIAKDGLRSVEKIFRN